MPTIRPLLCLATATAAWAAATVELENRQSGISVSLSGTNGVDWAVERTYGDGSLGEEILHVRSSVSFSLAHNERNTLVHEDAKPQDRKPGTRPGAGVIRWKIDRDQQSHRYTGAVPAWAPAYDAPFSFATLTYDGTLKVLGTCGDNGGAWGTTPADNTTRWYYGTKDAFGNEWHTLTYWDDDLAFLAKLKIPSHRQGASDGHCVAICVDPRTPVLQFRAREHGQFYTTPVKTYHVPRIWEQTTYLAGEVDLNFVNLTNDQPVQYRLGDGAFVTSDGTPVDLAKALQGRKGTCWLEARCGADGLVYRRRLECDPPTPAAGERHGYLLWGDDDGRARVLAKLAGTKPFSPALRVLREDLLRTPAQVFSDERGSWRAEPRSAGVSLDLAFVAAVDGVDKRPTLATQAKQRLLRLARLQPVGTEGDVNADTPAKDFLNELGQTIQLYTDAAVAYDLLASCFRRTHHPEGMSAVEEIFIRDGLAKIAMNVLGRMRDCYGASIGGGDTHWAYAYEYTAGTIALAMPTYKTPYYGVSGGDRTTLNDRPGSDGLYWNPYPQQGVTWYQVATDPTIATLRFPNVRCPPRVEFLLSDDGWWTGPNDFACDGDRYYAKRLVDVPHRGLTDIVGRIELIEMSGYESAFPIRFGAFCAMRRIAGDQARSPSSEAYLRRRLVHGVVPLAWDGQRGISTAQEPQIASALTSFNRWHDFAALPAARAKVSAFLGGIASDGDLRKQLANPYILALCEAPDSLPATQPAARVPVIKPLMKHVVRPGTLIQKDIIAIDLSGGPLQVRVDGLPAGAAFDAERRRISWTPQAGDNGLHLATITATNASGSTVRPFPMIVCAEGKPAASDPPEEVHARHDAARGANLVSWKAPAKADGITAYFIYRDGIFCVALPATATTWEDREFISPRTHTRYHLASISPQGGESQAIEAAEGYVTVPAKP